MKIKNILKKSTAVICAVVLGCGFVLPSFSSFAGTNEVDITKSTTMGNAHTGWQDGCWTVFIDPGDSTIASDELADGTSAYFYINNHENINNVDMASYVLINGVSVREHINQYTGNQGTGFPMNAGAVYNPILMDTFQPYDNIRVSVLSEYLAMSDLHEVTLKEGFSWKNQSGETLKVTKDVTYTYASDGTATRKTEEPQKIGWKDFGVTKETTCKDTLTELTYTGASLNNTIFEGDITFSACSELRYAGVGGWLGLQLSLDGSGRFRIVEQTYGVETIGDWTWPQNPYNERVFTPADLGITEYDSFDGKKITLKIQLEDMTETTAKVTVSINDKVVGGTFKMTSKDANTFKTGKVMGVCGNVYGAYNPITIHVDGDTPAEPNPPVDPTPEVFPEGFTELTHVNFGIDNGEYTVTNGELAATGEVTDRSSFDKTYLHIPKVTFTGDVDLNFFGFSGWEGFKLRSTGAEGTLAITSGWGQLLPAVIMNSETAKVNLVGGTYDLKVTMEYKTETELQIGVWFNDVLYNNSYITADMANKGSDNVGMYMGLSSNDAKGGKIKLDGAVKPETPVIVEKFPKNFTELTHINFGIDNGEYTVTNGELAATGEVTDRSSFDKTYLHIPKVTFTGDVDLNFFGFSGWEGFKLRSSSADGTLAITSGWGQLLPAVIMNSETAKVNLVGGTYDLKVTMEYKTETELQIGVWFNDVLYNNSYITADMANKGSDNVGMYMGLSSNDAKGGKIKLDGAKKPQVPVIAEKFPENFTELTHINFGIDNGEYTVANGELAATGEVTDRSSFDKTYLHIPKVTFTGDADLNFFGFSGWEGFKLRSTGADGTLAITSGWGQLLPAVIMNSETAKVNLVGGTYDLKVTMEYKTETKLQIGVWFNDVLYDNSYITVDMANKGEDNVGMYMGLSSYSALGGKIKLAGAAKPQKPTKPIEPPKALKKITLSDFGGNIESRTLAEGGLMSGELKKLKSYQDVLFDADVDFSTPTPGDNTYIRFGGGLDGWLGLSIQTRTDGTLALIDCKDNRLLTSFQTKTAGVNFYEKKFNLKVSFEYIDSDSDGAKDDLRLGVYFNNRLYDNEYVILKDRVADMTKWLLVYTDDIVAHPLTIRLPGEKDPEPIQPDADLKIISFSSFGIEDADFTAIDPGNFCASGLYRDVIKGKTLDGTLFHGKVKFSTVYGADIRLGGTKDGWSGIRLATTGDGCLILEDTALENKKLSKILSPAVAGSTLTDKWLDLKISIQYVDNDGDGKKDDVKLGVWLNGVLYENQYLYIDDFASSLGSYMGIYSSNVDSHISIRSVKVVEYIDLSLFGFDDSYQRRFKTVADYQVAGKPRGVTESPFTGEIWEYGYIGVMLLAIGIGFLVCMQKRRENQ